MIDLYKFVFYKIYKAFQAISSRNAQNSAWGCMSAVVALFLFEFVLIVWEIIESRRLEYDEIAIPFLVTYATIATLNYFVFMVNDKYARLRVGSSKSFYVIISLVAAVAIIGVIYLSR
jgi:hypothetical protein